MIKKLSLKRKKDTSRKETDNLLFAPFDPTSVNGVDLYETKKQEDSLIYLYPENNKAFAIVHKNTLELRTDDKLRLLLTEKYESVMTSRYFGRGGIEIVLSGQLTSSDLVDLTRLSYDLTKRIVK